MGAGKGKSRRARFVDADTRPLPLDPQTYYGGGVLSDVYAPLCRAELVNGTPEVTWAFSDGEEASFKTSPAPLLSTGQPAPGHDVWNSNDAWVGADALRPHLRFTPGAVAALTTAQAKELTQRYNHGDYGDGEAGFAAYAHQGPAKNQAIWVVDDAVRSPEGEPPARDPRTSPGPLTVLTPDEY